MDLDSLLLAFCVLPGKEQTPGSEQKALPSSIRDQLRAREGCGREEQKPWDRRGREQEPSLDMHGAGLRDTDNVREFPSLPQVPTLTSPWQP